MRTFKGFLKFFTIVLGLAPCFAGAATDPDLSSQFIDQVNGQAEHSILARALAQNPALKAFRKQIAEAKGQFLQSKLSPSPQLQVQFSDSGLIGESGEREVTVAYDHTFEVGGKRGKRISVAKLRLEIARLEVMNRERELKTEVLNKYAEAVAALGRLQATEKLLDLSKQNYDILKAQVQVGEVSQLDQGLLQVEVGRLQSDLLLIRNEAYRTILELKRLAGMNPTEELRLKSNMDYSTVTITLEDATAKALRTRPDFLAAAREIGLEEAQIRLARAEGIPDLVGSIGYSQSHSRFDQFGFNRQKELVPIQDKDKLAIGSISLSLPFWNRNQGNVVAATARAEAARSKQKALEQQVRQEVSAAYSGYQAARKALQIFDGSILPKSQENLEIIRASYKLGELRLLDLINQQRQVLEISKEYNEALKQYFQATINLEAAIGQPAQ
jgi:cobalt-zinc-cadmium efflux system outer membrane protein